MIPLKSKQDLMRMRAAGKLLAQVMQQLVQAVRPKIATAELDALALRLILDRGAQPAFKGYKGYPACLCVSVNEQVVHGIPSAKRWLEPADIVSLDLGLCYEGFYADAAVTVAVGRISPVAKKLIETTKRSLAEGIKAARCGNRLSDISHAVQRTVEQNGFSVVRHFVGHGIGRALHEEPEVPNFGKPASGVLLEAGMVLAIEPMVNAGSWECEILQDGWTAVTKDRSLSAHFEHTVAITENGPEILTA